MPLALTGACATVPPDQRTAFQPQPADARLDGQILAIAYSGYREGQHPDRGGGEVGPSRAEITEDLEILAPRFTLVRLYDSGPLNRQVLETIRELGLPIRVMLGAWLQAELSNHEGCAWLTEPIPEAVLATHREANEAEVDRTIALANEFSDVVVAINVGNEALVSWNDHLVSIERMVALIERVKAATKQPVSTADNYVPWIEYAERLGAVVDFAGVHTYPLWEGRDIQDGLGYTVQNLADVQAALPKTPIVIAEGGWTSVADEFGERASMAKQAEYFDAVYAWAQSHNVTTFFFEAFDEPWKGNPDRPLGAEKHWGFFDVQRRPKAIVQKWYPDLPPSPGP